MQCRSGRPRPSSVLACALAAAGLIFAAAGCASVTPLGPAAAAAPPPPRHLGSPIVLQAMLSQAPPAPPAGCPAGWATISAPLLSPSPCYRKLGTPVTFTSASVSAFQPKNPPGQPVMQPGMTGLLITLAAADRAALTALTTSAYNSQGSVAITVGGKVWAVPVQEAPLTGGSFSIALPASLARQLQHLLVPSS